MPSYTSLELEVIQRLTPADTTDAALCATAVQLGETIRKLQPLIAVTPAGGYVRTPVRVAIGCTLYQLIKLCNAYDINLTDALAEALERIQK